MATQPIAQETDVNPAAERERLDAALQKIVQSLHEKAAEAAQYRTNHETRWKKNLRQFHGVYDDDVKKTFKADDTRSKIFINITRPKTNAWAARLGDMLFPNDDKNWGIEPTPVPELSRRAKEMMRAAEKAENSAQALVDENNAIIADGAQPGPELEQQAKEAADDAASLRQKAEDAQAEIEFAERAGQLMEREIDDQLTESHYAARCRDVIDDLTKVGVGILKGPIVRDQGPRLWKETPSENDNEDADGEGARGRPAAEVKSWELMAATAAAPACRRVNYWHFFPDPSAERIDEAEYILERHLPNRKMLRKMHRELGFDADTVRKLLVDGPSRQGTGESDLNFMAELRGMEGGGEGDEIRALDDRYIVWEFYGELETEDVVTMVRALKGEDAAVRIEEEADPLRPMMVRAFFCDYKLLKIEEDYLLDSNDPLYSVGYFEKAEASILGAVGVPQLMENEQSMLNAAVRMMMDNAALAVGPQIVIDKEIIEPEDSSWKLAPRKVWQKLKDMAGSNNRGDRPFETFDIPMNQETLAGIIQLAMRFMDEVVSMPQIAQGEQGEHVTGTAHGMSMLFNSANVVFRRVVRNWDDDLTAPTIRRLYDFNMQFSDKDEIKGDMKVEARGTSVLLVREMQAEQLNNIIREYATHPILGVALKAYHCMRLVLQALSINPNDVLLDEDDYMQKLKEMEQAEAEGGSDPEQIKLQIAEMEAANRREIAEMNLMGDRMRLQGEMAKLAASHELSLKQIEAMFQTKEMDAVAKIMTERLKGQQSERELAAEIGAEKENARIARENGGQPTGSGGSISMGVEQ